MSSITARVRRIYRFSIVREYCSLLLYQGIKCSEQPISKERPTGTAGSVGDTYVAAIQHDLADLPVGATLVGVVRRPMGWFRSTVDENHSVLGPPPDLLDEFKERHEDLKLQGLCDEGAHNAAWEELGFDERYRTYLEETAAAQDAVAELADRLEADEQVVLVCFENTNQKRCHRTVLRDYIEVRLERS